MDKEQHLEWAKSRALEYVQLGQMEDAFTSMISDLRKQTEVDYGMGIMLGMNLKIGGFMSTKEEVTNWINGF